MALEKLCMVLPRSSSLPEVVDALVDAVEQHANEEDEDGFASKRERRLSIEVCPLITCMSFVLSTNVY